MKNEFSTVLVTEQICHGTNMSVQSTILISCDVMISGMAENDNMKIRYLKKHFLVLKPGEYFKCSNLLPEFQS